MSGHDTEEDDRYPKEEELARIRAWDWHDLGGLMAFVRALWWGADWGWRETVEDGKTTYAISTAGWSGNESLIDAMQDNRMVWALCWQSSRRGGHYVFRPIAAPPSPKSSP